MAYETASNQRKELIASTLKELLQTKPLSKISVTELVQHCRINRKTFYYHFEDIYALLKWMLEREIIEMLRQYDLLSDYDAALGFALDYIGENYTMLRNIYNSMEVEHLRRFFFSCFREITRLIIEEPAAKMGYRVTEEYKAFLIDFYTEGIVGGMIHEISNPSFIKGNAVGLYLHHLSGRHPSVLKGCPGKWPVMGQGKAFADMKPEGEINHLIKKCM